MFKYTDQEIKELARVRKQATKRVYVVTALKSNKRTARSRSSGVEYFPAKTKAAANNLGEVLKSKGYEIISIEEKLDELEF